MKVVLSLCVIALALAMTHGATCPDDMTKFRCYPYDHGNICMSDGTYICGNCYAEEKECRTDVRAILNLDEVQRFCKYAKKLDCSNTEAAHVAKYSPRKTASGQWF